MADHVTADDTQTPPMTKEDVYRVFVSNLDFWDDIPVLMRVMADKFILPTCVSASTYHLQASSCLLQLRSVLSPSQQFRAEPLPSTPTPSSGLRGRFIFSFVVYELPLRYG